MNLECIIKFAFNRYEMETMCIKQCIKYEYSKITKFQIKTVCPEVLRALSPAMKNFRAYYMFFSGMLEFCEENAESLIKQGFPASQNEKMPSQNGGRFGRIAFYALTRVL